METRNLSARSDVHVATTSVRVTPTPPRAGKFAEVLGKSVVRSAETAMRSLPGAPLMAVAVRGGAAPVSIGRGGMSGPEGPVAGASMSATGIGGVGGVGGVPGGAPNEASSIESSLQQSQDMNLYFLQIQEAVNAQNRSFTALSNVLKAQHDTVKTAIGNIR
jgi:hypothetical protein